MPEIAWELYHIYGDWHCGGYVRGGLIRWTHIETGRVVELRDHPEPDTIRPTLTDNE